MASPRHLLDPISSPAMLSCSARAGYVEGEIITVWGTARYKVRWPDGVRLYEPGDHSHDGRTLPEEQPVISSCHAIFQTRPIPLLDTSRPPRPGGVSPLHQMIALGRPRVVLGGTAAPLQFPAPQINDSSMAPGE